MVARQDRAWYNAVLAREQLRALGILDEEIYCLDTDPSDPQDNLAEEER